MNGKLDVKNFGYVVEDLDPKIMEKLATKIIELTPEDIKTLNNLKEKINFGEKNEL